MAAAGDASAQPAPEAAGVKTPVLPGDVSLSGNMPADVVARLAPRYAGWLYLNGVENPHFHEAALSAAGCRYEVVPAPSPASGSVLTDADAKAVVAAMARLPRPLMVQCTSANRAGAALALWLATTRGQNAASAELLARDLGLGVVAKAGPARDWVLGHLGGAEGGAARSAPRGEGYVVEQLFDAQGSSTFTYLVGCAETREAVLIDPVLGMQERDLALADELGFEIKHVVNTHCHADHVTSGSAIRKLRQEVRTAISAASGAAADVKLQDGDKVKVGRYALDAVATPGHTDGCMTFVLRAEGKPVAAFTGDTLLIRGCGRTDFQQGDAGKLYDSVHERIFALPDSTKIYPGHDYKGRNLSTVGEERLFNPRLNQGKEAFERIMKELDLPYPKLIDVAVPANMACGVQA